MRACITMVFGRLQKIHDEHLGHCQGIAGITMRFSANHDHNRHDNRKERKREEGNAEMVTVRRRVRESVGNESSYVDIDKPIAPILL